ncbi:cyclodeaminase/cyclohydrolase family protein [Aminobacterium sp. EBM-42]|uniref:cyclodeaminase/cyclohydrolase family protein n=1 Tax=Aminobacterium sp. EBM-42 TaxID=1918503 RepID=UPI000B126E1B|nr:cyclodeaminase/cyclohydrolase family protein [Aminobacterium sp. EBM-42]
MLVEMNLQAFVKELASDSPAPGGGSVAALSGALGAGLISMVCNLTIGKEGYEAYESDMVEVRAKSESLYASLLERIDNDTEAFNKVMAAFKMKKETDEDKAARKAAIQNAFKGACDSPFSIAEECLAVIRLADSIVDKGNINAVSDMGVAAAQALAGLEGAVMNVRINLPSIKDEAYVEEKKAAVQKMLDEGMSLRQTVQEKVDAKL